MQYVVAIVSVVVTGLAAPAIAASASSARARSERRNLILADQQGVIDECNAMIAQASRASGACMAFWKRGMSNEDEEVRDHFQLRHKSLEGASIAYGKLAIRFGIENDVVKSMQACLDALEPITEDIARYRAGEAYPADESNIDHHWNNFRIVRKAFIDHAHLLLRSLDNHHRDGRFRVRLRPGE